MATSCSNDSQKCKQMQHAFFQFFQFLGYRAQLYLRLESKRMQVLTGKKRDRTTAMLSNVERHARENDKVSKSTGKIYLQSKIFNFLISVWRGSVRRQSRRF